MAQTKRDEYTRIQELTRERVAAGVLTKGDADAILNWAAAYDEEVVTITVSRENSTFTDTKWGFTRSPSTLCQWVTALSLYARELDGSLFDATADDFNQVSQTLYDGTADNLSERTKANNGMQKGTVSTYQNCLRKFLQYYESDVTANPSLLHIFPKTGPQIDPADMLTAEEFHTLRNTPEHPRNRAIINFILYTGIRNHALRTLRIKDIDLPNRRYRLNPDIGGLKGADRVAKWNPLLGAQNAVREWIQYHPDSDNPDAYLMCSRVNQYPGMDTEAGTGEARSRGTTETISESAISQITRDASKRAAQEYPEIAEKPTNPQALRHNFVTMCKVRYGMDSATIKHLIHHKPDSRVMETTYAHLSDEHHIENAEIAFGIQEEDSSEPIDFSPDFCDGCNEPLKTGAKACPSCGTVYTPGAIAVTNHYPDVDDPGVQEIETIPMDREEKLEHLNAMLLDPEIRRYITDKFESDIES